MENQQAQELLSQINFGKYRDFNHITGDPYERIENFKQKIKENVSEILVLEIQNDINLSEDEKQQLPEEIQRFIKYSERGGIRYYILKTEEEIAGVFIGLSRGSIGRRNDYYMKHILGDGEIQKKSKKIKSSYSEFLKKE